jgi:DNA mismatch repair protein MutS
MAGKSTYIRQVALITLLAHAGSFVPAEHARVGLTDRIFTRVGADDALHAGQSTFMVEMIETANILRNATPRSLVVLDEIGRGTSTLDGLSLAWAITEHLAGVANRHADAPRTLFATHYHELTDLADRHPGRVFNLHVAVKRWTPDQPSANRDASDEIVFLHRIEPGPASESFGVRVAKLAGVPASVVDRADTLLSELSVSHGQLAGDAAKTAPPTPSRHDTRQMALFKEYLPHPAVDRIRNTDLDTLSPMQAFELLRELRACIDAPE